ncbi:MAG: class I SAM-dependent methyltransferase [Mycobacteriales bacterium]
MRKPVRWPDYVAEFHTQRAGITEDVLEHAYDRTGRTAYDWAAEPVEAGLVVLDLACGSGPMHARLNAGTYLGLDLSVAELTEAAGRALSVGQGDARQLPVADGVVDVVMMSMALMLVPLADSLREIKRVLRPGGVFVATVPSSAPLRPSDWLRYARLCLALRHRGLSYPNDTELKAAAAALRSAGLTLVSDERRSFRCDIADAHIAEQLLASLYLPEVPPTRMNAGRRVVAGWVGSSVATPIRRLVAHA